MLPEGTSPQVVKRLQGEGAEVQLTGKVRTPGRRSQLEWAVPLESHLPLGDGISLLFFLSFVFDVL